MRAALAVAILLSFALLPGAALTSADQPEPREPLSPARLSAALDQPVPVSDLWGLTANVKLHRVKPIRRVVHSHIRNLAVGRIDRFWVLNSSNNHYYREKARILCKTAHAYVYVQLSVSASESDACRSANVFESKIYPTDRRTYGNEWSPGIDHDRHVTIFFGHVPGVGGYFSSADEYPRIVNRFSNQREIVYINSDATTLGHSDFNSTLAHEFQHMIHWHVHADDEAWDNEGASMLAQVLNGYSADGVDQAYAFSPVQLDSWTNGSGVSANYGAGFLWLDYLYEHFGRAFIHGMLADSSYSGLQLAQRELAARHASLRDVFGRWVVANLINSRAAGIQYGYRNTSIKASPTTTWNSSTFRYLTSVRPYTPLYVKLKPFSGTEVISFHGSPTVPLIGPDLRGPFWWSNRCDFCDTSMTRVVNLSSSSDPVLTFKAWYDIERDYDYAYVEASTDSGATWHTLPAGISTNQNPNGGNIGNGITGKSTKVAGNANGWVQAKVDLRHYAGKTILLRFQYVTDDEYNGQSFAVRDIAIKRAGWTDQVASTQWARSGFVPVTADYLPMRWSIRLVTYRRSRPPSVQTVPVDSSGNALVRVSSPPGFEGAVIVMFGQAPRTTLPAPVVLFRRV